VSTYSINLNDFKVLEAFRILANAMNWHGTSLLKS